MNYGKYTISFSPHDGEAGMTILINNTDQQTQVQSLVDTGALESECLGPNRSSTSDKLLNLDESQKLQAPVLSCVKQGRGGGRVISR